MRTDLRTRIITAADVRRRTASVSFIMAIRLLTSAATGSALLLAGATLAQSSDASQETFVRASITRTGKPLPSLHSPLFAPAADPTIKTGVTAMTAAVLELM